MTMDVRQAFLHQAEYGEFHVRGEPSEVAGNIQLDTKSAALLQSLQVPAKCRRKSHLVQHWRVQQIRRSAYLSSQTLNQIPGFFDGFAQSRRVALRLILNSRHSHRQSSQVLAGAVVQVTGNSPPFLILRGHQSS